MLLLAAVVPAWATVYAVDPAGTGDFLDLPTALAVVADGDTLALAPGTYPTVALDGKVVRIEAIDPQTVTLFGVTVTGGDVLVRGVRFVDAPDAVEVLGGRLTIESATFVGFAGAAAVRAGPGSDVSLVGVDMERVTASLAPVVVDGGRLTVTDSRFSHGVGALSGAILATHATLDVSGSSFTANRSTDGAGAIGAEGGATDLRGSDFSDNLGVDGGAVGVVDGSLSGTDLVFANNYAGFGGQLALRDGSVGWLARVWMSGGGAEEGAGIAVEDAALSATNLVLRQGEALDVGGGVFLAGGVVDLRYAVVTENAGGIGGGLAVDDGILSLQGVIVVGNFGGDIANASGTPVRVEASLFSQSGGAMAGDIDFAADVVWGDPRFVDPAGDYALSSWSPGLDAGPWGEGDRDHTRADIGAFGGLGAWGLPDADGDGEVRGRDCDDADASAHLGAPEVWYDRIDQDCGGDSDFDQDGDGFDSSLYGGVDCNDVDPTVNPGADERDDDGADLDCDGLDDVDIDGDGWPATVDCDDADPLAFPGAPDVWYDGIDRNCDGGSDFDADGDGADRDMTDCDDTDPTVYVEAPEVAADGVDQDCDGADLLVDSGHDSASVDGVQASRDVNFRSGSGGCNSTDDLGVQALTAAIAVLALTGRRRFL